MPLDDGQVNPYAATIDQIDRETSGSANIHAPVAQPDAAAQALTTAPSAGVPPGVVLVNPTQANDMAVSRRAQAISSSNPAMARWASGDPVKVAATRDDFGPLSRLANMVKIDPLADAAAGVGQIGAAWKALQRDFGRRGLAGVGTTVGEVGNLVGSLSAPLTNPVAHPFGQALAAVSADPGQVQIPLVSQLNSALRNAGIGQEYDTREGREQAFTGTLNTLLGVGLTEGVARAARGRPGTAAAVRPPDDAGSAATPPPRAPDGPSSDGVYPTTPDGHVAAPDGQAANFATPRDAANWIVREGHPNSDQNFEVYNGQNGEWNVRQTGTLDTASDVPSPGVSAAVDAVRSHVANLDEGRLADLEAAAVQTKTLGRSPELLDDFLSQHTDGQVVQVSPEAIAKTWEGGDTPFADMAPEIQAAAERGANVEIPLSRYVSDVAGQPFADQLRSGVRVREDGFSPDEAKTVSETKPAETVAPDQASAPQQPKSTVVPEEVPRTLAESTQEKVQRLVKAQYLKQLFDSPQAAGMIKTQFDRYNSRIEDAIANATDKLHQKIVAQIKRERKPQWQEAMAKHRADAAGELDDLQPVQAYRQLTETGFKLDRAQVEASYPNDAFLIPKTMLKAKGNSPDDAAEFLGFDSGGELVQAIADLQASIDNSGGKGLSGFLKLRAEAEAEARTRAELGWDFSPDDIERAASEALSGPEITDFLSEELSALAKQENLPFDKARLQARAMELFSDMPLSQALKIKEFERLVGRTGRNAEVNLLKGKAGDAFIAKQHQLINTYMLNEAHKLTREFSSAMSKWTGWAGKSTVPTMDQAWLNHIHQSLREMGFNVRRDPEELEKALGGQTLDQFAEAAAAQGKEVVWGDIPQKSPKDQKVGEFRAARDTLKSLAHNGGLEKRIQTSQAKEEINAILAEIKASGDRLGRKLQPWVQQSKGIPNTAGKFVRGFVLAPNIRMEQLFDDVDDDNPFGALSRAVTEPLQKAKAYENEKLAHFSHTLREFMDTQPKEWLGTMSAKITTDNLPEPGFDEGKVDLTDDETLGNYTDNNPPEEETRPQRMTEKGHLVCAVLNMGTESNYQKLLKGMNWDRADFETAVDKHMTEADWKFVQKVWSMYAEMWPDIEVTYRKLAGVPPTKLPGRTIQTKFGEVQGDYSPLRYDLYRAPSLKQYDAESMFGPEYSSGLPSNPYAKGRTGYTAPLTLEFESLFAGLAQTVHDIAFREPLMNANKILSNQITVRAIQDNYGVEFSALLKPWLNYIARNKISSDASTQAAARYVRAFRANGTFVGLAYRAGTALKHGAIMLSDSLGEVPAKHFASAVRDLYLSPASFDEMHKFVRENSTEIPHRMENMDRDIRDRVQQLVAKQGFLSDVEHFGYHFIAWSDLGSSLPTWLAAQRWATQDLGMSPLDSYVFADKAVRKAHGSSAAVDLPAMLRGGNDVQGEMGRLMTMFLTSMNHATNRVWKAGRVYSKSFQQFKAGDWAGGRRNFGKASAKMLMYLVTPAILLGKLQQLQEGGDLFGLPSAKQVGIGIVHNTVGAIPGVGTVMGFIERGDAHSLVEQASKNLKDTGLNAWNATFGHRHLTKQWLREALDTAGYFGAPISDQMAIEAQMTYDMAHKHQVPKDVGQLTHDVIWGPQSRQHRHK